MANVRITVSALAALSAVATTYAVATTLLLFGCAVAGGSKNKYRGRARGGSVCKQDVINILSRV